MTRLNSPTTPSSSLSPSANPTGLGGSLSPSANPTTLGGSLSPFVNPSSANFTGPIVAPMDWFRLRLE